MSARAVKLAELRYPEVAAIVAGPRPAVALIPIGSTEAHGPHLPLATDSLISEGMGERAAALLAARGIDAVLFPTIHYAVTDWAAGFPGTATLSQEAAGALVLEVCKAARAMGFTRVAIFSGHLDPGHVACLRAVAAAYEAALREPLVYFDKTRRRNAEQLTPEFQSGSCHAGQYETSIVLALRPDLVARDVAAALPERVIPLHEKIRDGARDFHDCGMDQAYCGAPAAATAEEGARTLERLGAMLADAVEAALPR
ncbi:MAG: creatininase family protein [Nannocystaceae bacterium]|nr:creatininase family protein [Myxococcales bacterium]